MRYRASGLALSTLTLLLVTGAPHASAEPLARDAATPTQEAAPTRAATPTREATAMASDAPTRVTGTAADLRGTQGSEKVHDPGSKSPPSAWKGPPRKLGAEEKTRRYRALGLPEARLGRFLRSGKSLTTWYNEEHLGGYGLAVGGMVLVTLGAVSLLAAATITGVIWIKECPRQSCDDDGSLGLVTLILAIPAAVAGVIELGAGIPMVVGGIRRMERWVPDGELDRASIGELERRRAPSRAKPKTTISLLPYLTRGGGGLSLSLRF